ncbi:Cytochrome c oxidase subunit 4 isoform 2, mitochondrial [Eufriesea mexicana]|uniref:Cytochrome c oxidase subunit 4 isoform 2, mitochondrial n=1 Tax=Eufriesea mexicana TaxID=516756 RepID=A0A310SC08_9HYME|nr:Cytochrome c oxidase subunit 4 isoform 2, mitochondrial [Eufriesea mexicana]
MANKVLMLYMRQSTPMYLNIRKLSAFPTFPNKIGNRDIVGHGYNGEASYLDRVDCPMPAIRFKANTPDILKEKGDWKKLSIEEKKALYRASYCQTFSEFLAPTGEWKGAIGMTLIAYPPMPESFNEENRLAQLKRMKLLEINPVTGISSK